MTLYAVDAAGHPTPLAVKNAGYVALVQYLVGYAMPSTYPAACTNAGLPLVSAWELEATAALTGGPRGSQDGVQAVHAAKSFGQPQGTAIYAAVDFQPTAVQLMAVKAYARAWAAELRAADYLAGIYGGSSTMTAVRGLVDRLWQSYAWSSGTIAKGICLYQSKPVTVDGVTCDLDEIVSTPGAWTLDGPVYLFAPDPTPEDPMIAVVTTTNGQTHVFQVNETGDLWHKWQATAGPDFTWGNEQVKTGTVKLVPDQAPTVRIIAGGIHVFTEGTVPGRRVQHNFQAVGGSTWGYEEVP